MAKIYPILQCNIQKYFLIQLEAKHVLERELMIPLSDSVQVVFHQCAFNRTDEDVLT